jgi:hypothetical protein
MRRRLPLPPGAARCPDTRQASCGRAAECARAVEPHAMGRPAQDFSIEPRPPSLACGWFVPIRYAELATAGPTVHDAPGGLG